MRAVLRPSLLSLTLVLLALAGEASAQTKARKGFVERTADEARVERVLQSLSLREKVGQLMAEASAVTTESGVDAFVDQLPSLLPECGGIFRQRAGGTLGGGQVAARYGFGEVLRHRVDADAHGREAGATSDARTATKPVTNYRNAPPTGNTGLMDISTTKDK